MELLLTLVVLAYTLFAHRLSRTPVTAPMIFLALGLVMSVQPFIAPEAGRHLLHLVAEVTLMVLLFIDAAQINLRNLLRHHQWGQRVLVIGMPLALAIGTAGHWLIAPDLGWEMALLVGALLIPTDAALGQPVISNDAIPPRPRRTLSVESGLNDGLALPLILIATSLLATASTAPPMGWTAFAALQVTMGPLVGGGVGWLGGRLFIFAKDHDYSAERFEGIGALALAALIYLLATAIGGNGFIAAFVGGLLFNQVVGMRCRFVYEFTESEGKVLSWSAFLLIGMLLIPEALAALDARMLGIILMSLFVARPLAVYLSLLGTNTRPSTRLFFGWFGPRGLATALFALLIIEQLPIEHHDWVLNLAVNAVWISALLHGVTAAPIGRLYARHLAAQSECAERRTNEPAARPLPHPTNAE
ncbi:cation:proton antiporter [Spiribacter sp. 1M153]|uniref:cation:proton antiporter n=1 Tax=Spiribacter roseus TaxID=1855875 RepID=UPI00349F39EA